MTDGICNDMKDLADALVKYRDHPISFVVSCLGPLRTETMHYFAVSSLAFLLASNRKRITFVYFALFVFSRFNVDELPCCFVAVVACL